MKGGLTLLGAVLVSAAMVGFAVYGLWSFAMGLL